MLAARQNSVSGRGRPHRRWLSCLSALMVGRDPDRDHRARVLDGRLQPRPESGLQEPPLSDTDSPEALSSKIPSDLALEFRCTRSVEVQVRSSLTSRAMMVFMISEVPP
jgi:hypothetical protein